MWPVAYRQNNASKMMMGNGMPSNQSSKPRPKPMMISYLCSRRVRASSGEENE
jgi:hypothetical protein